MGLTSGCIKSTWRETCRVWSIKKKSIYIVYHTILCGTNKNGHIAVMNYTKISAWSISAMQPHIMCRVDQNKKTPTCPPPLLFSHGQSCLVRSALDGPECNHIEPPGLWRWWDLDYRRSLHYSAEHTPGPIQRQKGRQRERDKANKGDKALLQATVKLVGNMHNHPVGETKIYLHFLKEIPVLSRQQKKS